MTDPFSDPTSGFDRIQDYADYAMIVTPREYRTGLTTVNSKAPGDTDAVDADVVVLYPDGTVKELTMLRIFPRGLVGQFRRSMGQMVIGRLGKVPSKKGHEAWVFKPATPEDRALGVKYLEAKANNALKTPASATSGSAPSTDPFA